VAPRVTAVLLARGDAALLQQSRRSVLTQEVDLELLVVGEVPTTGMVAEPHAGHDLRVVPMSAREPHEVVHARNVGVRRARGAILAFIDEGDLWLPGKLREQLSAMERDNATWAYGAGLVFSEGPVLEALLPAPPPERAVARLPYVNVVPGGGSNVIVKREALEAVGGFDARVPRLEDWDLWIRLARLGPPTVVETTVVASRWQTDNTGRAQVEQLLASAREMDVRYRELRDGEPLDWADLHRWLCHDALRVGHRATALRLALRSLRDGHPGAIRLAVRTAFPLRRRAPVQSLDAASSPFDRFRPPRVVAWPPETEEPVRRLLVPTRGHV
jgi:hypothetical protein